MHELGGLRIECVGVGGCGQNSTFRTSDDAVSAAQKKLEDYAMI